jgi:hypothetical protein
MAHVTFLGRATARLTDGVWHGGLRDRQGQAGTPEITGHRRRSEEVDEPGDLYGGRARTTHS